MSMDRPFRFVLLCPVLAFTIAHASSPDSATVSNSTESAVQTEQVLRPPEPGRFKQLFQPFRTDTAAISPDGKYLAYSIREGDAVSVVVVEIDHPETFRSRVRVVDDEAATPMMAMEQREKTPGRINWMRWVSPTRIVVETNQVSVRTTRAAGVWQSWRGTVLGFDADGTHARKLAGSDDLVEFSEDTGARDFSSDGLGKDRRTITPQQPMPTGAQIGERGNRATLTFLDLGNPDAPAIPNAGTNARRTLQIFDVDPKRPGSVTVIATGAPRNGDRSLGFYSLNSQNGKLSDLTYDVVTTSSDALLDRQGHIRITLPNTLRSKFPFRYEYLGPRGKNRARPLGELSGTDSFSVSPGDFFGPRSIPLGFDEDPNVLYFASNEGRDTYGIYSLNLATQQRGKLTMENPAYDLIGAPSAGFPAQSPLIFDRFQQQLIGVRYENTLRTTAWLRPEWQAMQAEFEKQFPGRSVDITDWDKAGRRFIVTTERPGDPGALHLYDREKGKLFEFARRAPWVDASHTHLTLPFSYEMADGARISGLITAPKRPRLKPVPVVILCPDLPWDRVRSGFQADTQALADMGFVVVQLNGRGAWGLGLKQRQSLTAGYDLVQVDDIAMALTHLEKLFSVNLNRVALMGRGHGGFIALRALQAYPEKFRCAIALDAPVNLGDWIEQQRWTDDDVQIHLTRAWLGDEARLKAAPLTSHLEAITKPVLMLNYPGPNGAPHSGAFAAASSFAGKVKRQGTPIVFDVLRTDYMNGLPTARAEVFDRIEEFLNLNVYDFSVKVPDFNVVK